MLKHIRRQALTALWLVLAGTGVEAHHSAAGVDQSKTVSVVGTLRDFDFSAPHAQIVVTSKDSKGAEVQTKVATIAPQGLVRQGFKPKDFETGQQVEMTYHPNINKLGGIMVTLKLQDGRVVKGDVY